MGFDMTEGSESERIATALNERGLGGDHFIKCMEVGMANKRLQTACELVSGRKEAGRYLQLKPLVIQCHSCQGNFSTKKGQDFAGPTIYMASLNEIMQHLITCDGVICDCCTKVLYFDTCKKCKRKWDERSVHLRDLNQDYVTPEQKKQIEIYNKKYGETNGD